MAQFLNKLAGARAFFTGSDDGNMSIKDDDGREQGVKNRERMFAQIGVPVKKGVFCQQTHSDNVYLVAEKDAGSGSFDFTTGIPDTDSLITKVRGIILTILVADCVPILLFDSIGNIVGAVHAGWKGTMKQVLRKTVKKMVSEFGTDPTNIVAIIGPSIGPGCFEIGQDVIDAADESGLGKFIVGKKGKGNYFDLWSSNKHQLMEEGVLRENINVLGVCNHCSPEYFSYRRDKNTNRFAAGIALK